MTLNAQERFAPCRARFGYGPVTDRGLRIGRFPQDDALVATGELAPRREAVSGPIGDDAIHARRSGGLAVAGDVAPGGRKAHV